MNHFVSSSLPKMFDRLLSGGRSALLILIARMLQNINGFLLTAVVAQSYGLHAVGTLTLATIPTTFVALFGTFGLQFRFARMNSGFPVCNSLGVVSVLVAMPCVAVLAAVFALAFGHAADEQLQLFLLTLSSPFFAQTSVTSALQILQKKEWQSIIAPCLNTIGVVTGIFAPDFDVFCLSVLVFRSLGIVLPYVLLPQDFSAIRGAAKELRNGMQYLFSDAVVVVSDNVLMLACTGLLGRSELGILGICRQLLTASDTPGWASVQSVYPKLVAEDQVYCRKVVQSMFRLGIVLAVAVAVIAAPAGIYIFKAPDLWFYALVLMASVPARYIVVTIETFLKAKGLIRLSNYLTSGRAILSFMAVYTATAVDGLKGYVIALALFFIAVAVCEMVLVARPGFARQKLMHAGETK